MVLAVTYPWAPASSYLSSQSVADSRCHLYAAPRSSYPRRSRSCRFFLCRPPLLDFRAFLVSLSLSLTRAQYLDEVTWTTKSWLGLQKQRISVVLHTAIAEQIVNELACGEGGRVHGAKCLAVLAGVA